MEPFHQIDVIPKIVNLVILVMRILLTMVFATITCMTSTKLLLVVTDLFETVAKVYTFGEEEYSGKRLQNFPCRPTVRLGKFVSGTLNWIAEGAVSDDRCVILSPDVGTEHMANSRCLIGTVTIM